MVEYLFKIGDKVKISDKSAFMENIDFPDEMNKNELDIYYDMANQFDHTSMIGEIKAINKGIWTYEAVFEHEEFPISSGCFDEDELEKFSDE